MYYFLELQQSSTFIFNYSLYYQYVLHRQIYIFTIFGISYLVPHNKNS